jgi:hypothetical protein
MRRLTAATGKCDSVVFMSKNLCKTGSDAGARRQ